MRLRLLWLAFALALPAAAQFTCQSSGGLSPKNVRAEGKSELVNDVLVTCTGGVPGFGEPLFVANFTLTFNANVTSKTIGSGNLSEALVLLDEPPNDQQYPCTDPFCNGIGNGTGFGYYGQTIPAMQIFGVANVYEGVVGTGPLANTITFFNVPVDPPGQGIRQFRFTNLRLDPSTVRAGTLQLTAIDVVGQAPFTSIGGVLTLGAAQTGLTATVRDATNSVASPVGVPVPLAAAGSPAVRVATLRFSPGFNGATKARTIATSGNLNNAAAPVKQADPGVSYNAETGFFNPNLPPSLNGANLASAGLADWGTRLMANFTNIPSNVTVYVSLLNDGAALINAPWDPLESTCRHASLSIL